MIDRELTIKAQRESARIQAAAWNENEAGLRDTSTLIEWRDNCRDELIERLIGTQKSSAILEAWTKEFDSATAQAQAAPLKKVDSAKLDEMNELGKKSAHLHALLATLVSGFDEFSLMNDKIRQNYLWACADIAADIETLANGL